MYYIIHYTCPHCKHPDCGEDPMKRANEIVWAENKTYARAIFTQNKPCRWMKIVEINETTLQG